MKTKVSPRQVPDRDSYYMGMAFWIASKSKDPRTQIGAYIINDENEPLGTGYNGPPQDIPDDLINWDRPDKYPFVHHAEDNAIRWAEKKGVSLKGATIYITAAPCKACMLDIARAKIKRVVFFKPKTDTGSMLASGEEWAITQQIAQMAHITLEEFKGNLSWMRDRIAFMESIGVFG